MRQKIEWDVPEEDALDILTLCSLVHRKLDRAKKLGWTTGGA